MNEHKSVLLEESLHFLDIKPGGRYIDATVGAGGHTTKILEEGGEVLGLDQDPTSLDLAERRLHACPGKYRLVLANFGKLDAVARETSWDQPDGILFDLGFASFQIDNPERGLSFLREGPLDMRLDPDLGVTAADLVNSIHEKATTQQFQEYGQEPRARLVARRIVEERGTKPFTTTTDLADLVKRLTCNVSRIHPATRVFQALRIAVNMELENLEEALPKAFELIKSGGRIVVITFHSGEDRIVKHFFERKEKEGEAKRLTKKPVVPSVEEVKNNPRSRSAKLRVLEKS